MSNYSLSDLNRHIRQVIALNFSAPLWVAAEISQCGLSKGHYYLDLVQKEADATEVVAQGMAMIWAADHRRMLQAHGLHLTALLQPGTQVRIQVIVEFNERYGMKLQVIDIDPDFTLGQLEMQRRKTIEALRNLGLLARNRALTLPKVLQRVAIISSKEAAGYHDFVKHLQANKFGYGYEIKLFESLVQGNRAVSEITAALSQIKMIASYFDVVVLIRGGGSKLDLAVFDDFDLARSVAEFPLPIFTGIGHETDESVTDMVAHTALKTPTAVADFLLQHHLAFEQQLLQTAEQIRQIGEYRTKMEQLALERLEMATRFAGKERLRTAAHLLDTVADILPVATRNLLKRQQERLFQLEALCRATHPETILKRGYAIVRKKGKVIASMKEAPVEGTLEIQWHDGVKTVTSVPI
jgi:exodeoxyribonuclease VII large subunit